MSKGFIMSLIFAAIVGLFATFNSEKVIIDFIFTKVALSQAIVIIISALLGALVVFFLSLIKSLRLKQKIKKLEKENRELLDENNLIKDLNDKKTMEELEEQAREDIIDIEVVEETSKIEE